MQKDNWLEKVAEELREMPSQVNPTLWTGISAQIATPMILGVSAGIAKVIGLSLVVGTAATVAIVSWMAPEEQGNTITTPVGVEQQTANIEKNLAINTKEESVQSTLSQRTETTEENAKSFVKQEKSLTPISDAESSVNKEEQVVEKVSLTENTAKTATPINTLVEKVNKPVAVERTVEQVKKEKIANDPLLDKPAADRVQEELTLVKIGDLPNVFTPNGDGANDEFFVQTEGIQDFSLVVMNSQSQVIWKTTNPIEKWNGRTFTGERAPVGDYIYILSGKDDQGKYVGKHQRLKIQY